MTDHELAALVMWFKTGKPSTTDDGHHIMEFEDESYIIMSRIDDEAVYLVHIGNTEESFTDYTDAALYLWKNWSSELWHENR